MVRKDHVRNTGNYNTITGSDIITSLLPAVSSECLPVPPSASQCLPLPTIVPVIYHGALQSFDVSHYAPVHYRKSLTLHYGFDTSGRLLDTQVDYLSLAKRYKSKIEFSWRTFVESRCQGYSS